MNSLRKVLVGTIFPVCIALICLGCGDGLPETQLVNPHNGTKFDSPIIDIHDPQPVDGNENELLEI